MSKQIRRSTDPSIQTRDMAAMTAATGNIYESVAVIAKRARQISSHVKEELNQKISEFSLNSDSLEEVFENKEQIEISRQYERMPKPSIMAIEEFLEGKLYYRYKNAEEKNADL